MRKPLLLMAGLAIGLLSGAAPALEPPTFSDEWDFNWQGTYTFAQPVPLPAGTRIDMVAVFDNSAENLRQPSRPPRPVRWGEGTTDEMAIVFLGVTVDHERIGWRPPVK